MRTLSLLLATCLTLSACDLIKGSSAPQPVASQTGAAASAPTATPAAAPSTGQTPVAPAPSVASAPLTSPSGVQPPLPAPPIVGSLDVGKVGSQSTRALGGGKSLALAVNDAIRTAILQVNGTAVDLSSQQFRFAADLATPFSDLNIRAAGFADVVQQRSKGAITGFKLESAEGPDASGNYRVWIDAQVAKYAPPEAESKKIKLVIAPIRFDSPSFTVGGRSVRSESVAQNIRTKVIENLSQTGRFAVLDREFDPEIQQELDMVESGATSNTQYGKLNQAFSADLVWIGRIRNLGYHRHSRELRASDKALVSYSGGWSVSQKMVNVATKQVLLAKSLSDRLPSTAPTTLGTHIDSDRTLATIESGIVQQVVASIMSSTFPISVVSRDGHNVILSQGANALKVGDRYQVIALGAEIRDPQTGQSLGRVEGPCCEVVIDRVASTMSYGRLEAVRITLDEMPAGSLLLRESIAPKPDQSTTTGQRKASARPRAEEPPVKVIDPIKTNTNDW